MPESLTDTNGTRYVDNTVVFGAGPALIGAFVFGPSAIVIWGGAALIAKCAEIHDRKYDSTNW